VSVLAPSATRYAPNGMACAVDHLAAEAGVAAMRAGGSAADAAVAAGAVLAVTTQHMCGMGGDLLAVVQAPGEDPRALVASGRAGSGADPERLRSEGHRTMPVHGDIRSVPVPGCVDGWLALHTAHGRLPLAELLAPAAAYAAEGFPASPTLAASAPSVAALAPDFAGPIRAGDRVRRPGVARALGDIAAGGREAFYQGEFGRGLLALGPSEYDPADLAAPQAEWRLPVTTEAWGRRFWVTPPPTQAYVAAAAAWIASGLDVPAESSDPRWAHLLIESARQAAHDRPDVLHEGADGRALVAEERLAARRSTIGERAAPELGGRFAPGGTVGFCAVDEERMGVAVLQSNATGFGAGIVEPSTGIFLHNRGLGFSLEPGHPAEYGPGRRPPHTLSPLLVTTTDNALAAVMASMGGDSQPLILLQLLARRLVGSEPAGSAVAAGRWTLASRPPGAGPSGFAMWSARGDVTVRIEGHAPERWAPGLQALGHQVETTDAFSHEFGHAHLIEVRGDTLAAASDPRPLAGAAAGW